MKKKQIVTEPRLTHQSLRVLNVFLSNPTIELAGSDVFDETRLASGTLYPILMRLEDAGWLKSRWEPIDSAAAGKPRRRLYHFTALGQTRATAALADFRGTLPA
jgi:DNA-binding PadR family transcriptional regulator